MEIEMKLKSPIPAMARVCPQEKIRLWKRGHQIRIDWTLAKVRGLQFQRAPMSFFLTIDRQNHRSTFKIY
jgi:hypothetical protein